MGESLFYCPHGLEPEVTLAFTVAGVAAPWVADTVVPPRVMMPVLASLADALPLLATI